jgi:hypothetical protein
LSKICTLWVQCHFNRFVGVYCCEYSTLPANQKAPHRAQCHLNRSVGGGVYRVCPTPCPPGEVGKLAMQPVYLTSLFSFACPSLEWIVIFDYRNQESFLHVSLGRLYRQVTITTVRGSFEPQEYRIVEALQFQSNTLSHWSNGSTVCFPPSGQRFASGGCTRTYNGTRFSY